MLKPLEDRWGRITLQQVVRLKQGILINPLLDIMSQGKYNGKPDMDRLFTVLQDGKNQTARVREFGKKEEIKIFVRGLFPFVLGVEETDRLF